MKSFSVHTIISLLVDPYVGLQRALGCKTLSTDLTGEGLLPCTHTVISRIAPCNSIHCFNTEVWPGLTCVSSQVLFQLSCVHELVMTVSTFRH